MAKTSEYEKHLKFLGKPLPGLNEIVGRLHKDHVYLLENYGAWMEALVKNTIQPLTEAQKKFVEVANGNRNEATRFEKAWINQGGILERTAVGDQNVHKVMVEKKAILGGEQSGHILSTINGLSGDGLLTALQISNICKTKGVTLAELLDQSFKPYPQ